MKTKFEAASFSTIYKSLEMLAKGAPRQEVLDNIVFHVEKAISGSCCSILLIDEKNNTLHLGSAPNLPKEYINSIINIPARNKEACFGLAGNLPRRIIVSNIENDPLLANFKGFALKHGLRSCWSIPICDNKQRALGIIALYFHKLCQPGEFEKQVIDKAFYLTNIVIQHYRDKQRINYLAYHDELTGLPNKRSFDEKVTIAINLFKKEPGNLVAVLYFDVDRFKVINESLGRKFGDLLLQQVAQRIQGCIRKRDITSRMAGDEFTILLDNVNKPAVDSIAQRILEEFSQPFLISGHELYVTPSIGISLFPQNGKTADELIKKADIAMYLAKNEGRNNFQFYHENLTKRNNDRLEIESELRKAIEKNEFTLHYQPIIDLLSNRISGVEALIRWDNPFRGRVEPDQFIPIAEETGMIIPIGELILKKACYQMKQWQKKGLYLSFISVNISIRQFFQPDLVSKIEEIIKETEIHPNYLTIEITESMTMDVEKASKILYDLKDLGVNISIDDFGTGYSSLSYLKKFPIDNLKIDRSFIRDIAKNKDDENIATTILLLAQKLGISVIAEGVETNEQLSVLRQHRCDEAQGYLFSKPLSEDQLNQFLSNIQKIERTQGITI